MKQRIYSLDALRGFSLFGIVIMNIVGFSHDTFHLNEYFMFNDFFNRGLLSLNVIFVHNSFYPIFALLFGYGLAMMKESADRRGARFIPLIYRRLGAMFIFGMLHGMLLFSGDILNSYAIVGMIGVWFLMIDRFFSLLGAAALWLYYLFIYLLPVFIKGIENPRYDYMGHNIPAAAKMAEQANSHDLGTIIHMTTSNFFDYFVIDDFDSLMFRVSSLLPIMLIGMYARRAHIFERVIQKPIFYYGVAAIFMMIGLLIKSLPIIFYGRTSYDTLCVYIGGVILSAGYMMIIILLSEHEIFRIWMKPVSNLGKLSFTAYILESLMMFIIVYGLGLFNRMDMMLTYSFAVLIYVVLLLSASLYLTKFKQGPLEWLWRKVTYLK